MTKQLKYKESFDLNDRLKNIISDLPQLNAHQRFVVCSRISITRYDLEEAVDYLITRVETSRDFPLITVLSSSLFIFMKMDNSEVTTDVIKHNLDALTVFLSDELDMCKKQVLTVISI